ncbi:hypothetical protein BJY04DRAFT_6936 [Aspergillus karnatakaensis]|uniref:uncharacterized protein n=1 Tax=Aspergillus karnatakaensis TaxID=1810916 RepID=UPI003CCE2B87
MPIPTRSVPVREPRKQPAATSARTVPSLKPSSAAAPSTDDAPSKPASRTIPSTLPTRRQSLIRPSQLKPPSFAKSPAIPTGARTVPRAPASPTKRDDTARQYNGRPPSPKKTDMPPPPRPIRSASLRQPKTSSTVTPTAPRGHARHKSQSVTPASKPSQTPLSVTTPRSKTQFSTYQQQSSPKKTAKPPTPTPASASAEQAASLLPSSWPEIAALQTELLQLSLLHTSWIQQNGQWESEAEAQLRKKYNSVARDYKANLSVEKESQRKLNGQALHCWLQNSCEHNGQQSFAEQVQLLSQLSQEVYDLSDSHGGRYTMAILEFENWLQKVEEVQHARLSHVEEEAHGLFVDPMRREWKEEIDALLMKLELALRQLQSLDILGYGDVEALRGSALLRTAKNLTELFSHMIEELNVVRQMEVELMKSETMRVSQLAQRLMEMQPREGPAQAIPRTGLWRRSSFMA